MQLWLLKKKRSWKYEMIDTIGKPLAMAEKELRKAQVKYTVRITRPTRQIPDVDEECFYVVRQQFRTDTCDLVVAAKMHRKTI